MRRLSFLALAYLDALELRAETDCQTAELWIMDLAEFASVRRFVDQFEQDGGRLDILVANAAVIMPKYEATNDGWETWLVLSLLAPSWPLACMVHSRVRYASACK